MKHVHMPPGLFHRFFRWYCHPRLLDVIEGDLLEDYGQRVQKAGKLRADLKFMLDVTLLLRPNIIKPFTGQKNLNRYGMFQSYFKIGWRNLLRNKGYSAINIGGLALGLTVAMIIGLWVYDELSFNTYFKNYDHIAQVTKAGSFQGKYYQGQTYLPYPLIEELKTNYASDFKHIVPTSGPGGFDVVLSDGDKMLTKKGQWIGEGAPEMLTLDMKYGNWSGLNEPNAIMISESTAKALYGESDPLGKVLKVNNGSEVTITGVYGDFPKNTEFYGLQFFRPWTRYLQEATYVQEAGWQNHFLYLYVELAPGKTFDEVGTHIRKSEMKAIEHLDYMKDELQYDYDVLLKPMAEWHLYANYKEGQPQNGPIQLVRFIGAIGVFVLLLACINFMNLSTARSEKRAKEVGIRKTIGSQRMQLINQFFSESFIVVILAFAASLLLVFFSLQAFNLLVGKNMQIPVSNLWFWLACGSFVFITGLLAGSYPALYLSSFSPVSSLKGTFRAGKLASSPRKVLVVVQFSVSLMLMVCTGVIYHQLMYVKDRPVGYSREGLLIISKKSEEFYKKSDAIRTELINTGVVAEVGEAGGNITNTWSHNGGFTWKDSDLESQMRENFATLHISHEFGRAVGWNFTDGRDFDRNIAGDSSAVVLNAAAVKLMDIQDPAGKVIHWKNQPWGMDKDFTIIGVIEDMVMGSPFEPVKPAVYFIQPSLRSMLIRIAPNVAVSDALPKIERVFHEMIPAVPFDYKFADEEFAAKFSNEEKVGKLAAIFTILAIFISCLGLFGLASFVAEQRTKEIGIRKVMGASVLSLWRMLSQEFVILVIVSASIAMPLAWYILSEALKNYTYHTEIGWWIFVTSGVFVMAITLMTISFQAVRAALANPVRSLRSE
jgi:putative ABC transport system permease protein